VADDTKPESPPAPRGTDLRTFLIADIRGYTRYTQAHSDDAASEVTARFAALVRETVAEYSGELLELRGDEALCVFDSPREAVRSAIELQRRLRAPAAGQEPFPLGVGIGLDAGEAVPTEGGYRGRALNFAARLCAVAKGGEILASEGLAHLAHPVAGVRFGQTRSIRLKGVGDPVRVVEVIPEEPLPPPPAPLRPDRRNRRSWVIGWIWRVHPNLSLGPRIDNVPGDRLAYGSGVLWGYGYGLAQWINLETGQRRHYPVNNGDIGVYTTPGLTIAQAAAWLAGPVGHLFQYNTSGLQRSIPIATGANTVATDGHWLWVAGLDGTITRINAFTQRPAQTFDLHHAAQGIACYDGRVWIAVDEAKP
jgi:class 3 adenylate cyclase